MKSLTKICVALFLISILFYTIGIMGTGTDKQSTGGYLIRSTYNYTVDTIGSASTNDTSDTFVNSDGYTRLDVEYRQNSVSTFFTINYPEPGSSLRVRYLASDSSFTTEKLGQGGIGWVTLPVLTQTSLTPASKITGTLRTGNMLLSFHGRN